MSDKLVSATTTIDAPPAVVFAIVANPHQHPRIDGSGSVRSVVGGPEHVRKGDTWRNLGSHATPCLSVDLASISSSISAGVRNPCLLRGLELSSAAMLSSMPGP